MSSPAVVPLGEQLHERLAVGDDREDVLEARDGVADAHLDRAEPWMQPDVPPDVRVVRDAARLLELAHDLGVVRVALEPRRRARARERCEDHLPARAEPGRLAAPERRAGGEGEQRADVRREPVDDLDRLVGIVDRDVDVHAEDELASRDVLHLVDERAIAVAGRDALALEEAEGVRAGGADSKPLLARDAADVAANLAQLLRDLARRMTDGRRDLEHRLHQLRVDDRLELVPGDRGEHGVDVLDEVERLRVEEHVLLLDSECVRVALAEGVVEDAPAGCEPRSFARDRRGIDLPAVCLHTGVLLLWEQCFSFDLDEPAWIEETCGDEHGAGGPDVGEHLAVRAPDFFPVVDVQEKRPRAHDVLGCGPGLGKGRHDDLEAAARLAVGVARWIGSLGHDRAGAGDEDVAAVAHGA